MPVTSSAFSRAGMMAGAALLAFAAPLNAQSADPQAAQALLGALERIEAERATANQRRIEEDRAFAAQIAELRRRLEDLAPADEAGPEASEAPEANGASVDNAFNRLAFEQATTEILVLQDRAAAFAPTFDDAPASALATSSATISTSTTATRVSIKLDVLGDRLETDKLDDAQREDIWIQSLNLTASAPVSGSEDRSQLFSLNGPESGFSLGATLNLRQHRFRTRSPEERVALARRRSNLAASLLGLATEACMKATKKTDDGCKVERQYRGDRSFVTDFLGDKENRPGGMTLTAEQEMKLAELIKLPQPIELVTPIFNIALNGTVSYNQFTYFDPVTAAVQENEGRTGFEAGIAGSLIYPDKGHGFSAGALFQRNYKDASNRAICPTTAPVGPFTACPVSRFGEPERDDSLIVRGEWRYLIGKGIAISPLVAYDALDDEIRLELPIYFVADDKKNLTGGIRLGYDSEVKNGVIFGIFVSTPFTL